MLTTPATKQQTLVQNLNTSIRPNLVSSLPSHLIPQMIPRTPRPILPQSRSTFDKLIDFFIGEGPSNRYALICKTCCSHNGMALKEEFEYLSFKCAYCGSFNVSRKQKLDVPARASLADLTIAHQQQQQQQQQHQSNSQSDSKSTETSSESETEFKDSLKDNETTIDDTNKTVDEKKND
jgi:endoplasmic reticulum junction formation protein lunapark